MTKGRGPRFVVLSFVVGIAILALFAVGWNLADSALSADGDDAGAAVEAGQEDVATKTVVDSAGRSVVIPAEPQHIAAMDSFAGTTCVLAGAGDRLYGAPGGVKTNELLKRMCPHVGDVAQLSGSTVNAEALLDGGVDVLLVKDSYFLSSDGSSVLDALEIPYVVIGYETVEEQIEAIELVGEVCGGDAAERARGIADYYRDTVELVEERAGRVPDDGKVRVYHSINDPLLTDGAESVGADWIARVGAVDVSAGEESTSPNGDYTATLEQVYEWEPDVVVCSTAVARDAILDDVKWNGLDAVSAGEVYNIPVSASRWGQRGDPETFLGMLWLGKTLYPELYEDIDLQDTVASYYRDVVGFEIDDTDWELIVAGEGLRAEGSGGGQGGEM